MPPIAKNRFLIEVDGVAAISATKATPGGLKQNLGKYHPGNQKMPIYFPGTAEAEEWTFTHGRALGQAGRALLGWLIDFSQGRAVEKRTLRFVLMDQAGRSPQPGETWEGVDCSPTLFKPSEGDGSSADLMTFDFSVQPDNVRMI
jgi:hypothetical protein